MSGDINLNDNDITGLPNTPTNTSAVSKTYLFLNYVANPPIQNINMNNKSIVNLKNFKWELHCQNK